MFAHESSNDFSVHHPINEDRCQSQNLNVTDLAVLPMPELQSGTSLMTPVRCSDVVGRGCR